MKEKLIEKVIKLLDVKTIITFAFVFSTIYFAKVGKIDAKEITSMALMAVSFYFGVKSIEKKV